MSRYLLIYYKIYFLWITNQMKLLISYYAYYKDIISLHLSPLWKIVIATCELITYLILECFTLLIQTLLKVAQGYLARKASQGNFLNVIFSLFSILQNCSLKSESLILFKLKKLIVAIEKKLAPGNHESSLKKKKNCELSLCRKKYGYNS